VSAESGRAHVVPQLTDLEARILGFERDWAARLGGRETAIRDEFGVSAARYYQILNTLLDSPLALQHDPLLVRRLQRLRETRRRARARTFGTETQDDTD
jgi:hypothetical protein